MPEGELLKAESTEAKPSHPYAGFWIRLGAVMIDLFVLYISLRTLGQFAPAVALAAGPAGYFIGFSVLLAYFTCCEGPLARGQTLGKALFNIRVLGHDFEPIGFGRAFLRSLVRFTFFLFLLSPFMILISQLFWLPMEHILMTRMTHWPFAAILTIHIINLMLIGFLVVDMMSIGQHPLKWALHDFWLQTCVVRDPETYLAKQWMQAFNEQGRPNQSYISALVGFVIIVGLLLFNFWRGFDFEQFNRQTQYHQKIVDEYGMEGAYPILAFVDERQTALGKDRIEKWRDMKESGVDKARSADNATTPAVAGSEATTEGLREIPDNEFRPLFIGYSIFYMHFGSFDPANEQSIQKVEALRDELYRHSLERYREGQFPFSDTSVPDDLPTTSMFQFGVIETYNLMLTRSFERDYISTRPLTLSD